MAKTVMIFCRDFVVIFTREARFGAFSVGTKTRHDSMLLQRHVDAGRRGGFVETNNFIAPGLVRHFPAT